MHREKSCINSWGNRMETEKAGFPFADDAEAKKKHMTACMKELTRYHAEHCGPYGKMLSALGYDEAQVKDYRDIPFLPVSLFKEMRLSSLQEEDNIKTVTSSGTSGQRRSQIILDAETRTAQQEALARIGSSFLGTKRLPMLVIDCPSTISKREKFTARTSGILGFSIFSRKRIFALNEDMTPDWETIDAFLENYGSQPFLIFGFTFMVWKYFLLEMEKEERRRDFSNGILIHGGGWKKLVSMQVSKEEYARRLKEACGILRVMDYYGMAEQTGSIYMECECGHLHCSDYSAILFRRPSDFSLCEKGEPGLIQVMSTLPRSYPGHSLLTEDIGRLLGEDDCPCGRKGVYFEVLGRAKNAELRGCSDTFAADRET